MRVLWRFDYDHDYDKVASSLKDKIIFFGKRALQPH
jgi:hypothetical protein